MAEIPQAIDKIQGDPLTPQPRQGFGRAFGAIGVATALLATSCGVLGGESGDDESAVQPTTTAADRAPINVDGDMVIYGDQTAADIMSLPLGGCMTFLDGVEAGVFTGDQLTGSVSLHGGHQDAEVFGAAIDFRSDQDPKPWNGDDKGYDDSLAFTWEAAWVKDVYPETGLKGFTAAAALDIDEDPGLDVQCADSVPIIINPDDTALDAAEAAPDTATSTTSTSAPPSVTSELTGSVDADCVLNLRGRAHAPAKTPCETGALVCNESVMVHIDSEVSGWEVDAGVDVELLWNDVNTGASGAIEIGGQGGFAPEDPANNKVFEVRVDAAVDGRGFSLFADNPGYGVVEGDGALHCTYNE